MKKDWVSTTEASRLLGISVGQLYKLREQGVFKAGKHYRKKNPIAYRPTYIWHIENCSKVLE